MSDKPIIFAAGQVEIQAVGTAAKIPTIDEWLKEQDAKYVGGGR